MWSPPAATNSRNTSSILCSSLEFWQRIWTSYSRFSKGSGGFFSFFPGVWEMVSSGTWRQYFHRLSPRFLDVGRCPGKNLPLPSAPLTQGLIPSVTITDRGGKKNCYTPMVWFTSFTAVSFAESPWLQHLMLSSYVSDCERVLYLLYLSCTYSEGPM